MMIVTMMMMTMMMVTMMMMILIRKLVFFCTALFHYIVLLKALYSLFLPQSLDSNPHFKAHFLLPGEHSSQATIYQCTHAKSKHNYVQHPTGYQIIHLGGVKQYGLNILLNTKTQVPGFASRVV